MIRQQGPSSLGEDRGHELVWMWGEIIRKHPRHERTAKGVVDLCGYSMVGPHSGILRVMTAR